MKTWLQKGIIEEMKSQLQAALVFSPIEIIYLKEVHNIRCAPTLTR